MLDANLNMPEFFLKSFFMEKWAKNKQTKYPPQEKNKGHWFKPQFIIIVIPL